jgi:ribonuclease-3
VVSGHALADLARSLNLGPLIKLGKGEVATHGDNKDSILADTVEAVIGAIHLSGGFAASTTAVEHWLGPRITTAASLGAGLDWKSSLQELTAAQGLGVPHYFDTASGPDHDRSYAATVRVGQQTYGPGVASNKRHAEQQAAQLAYEALTADQAGYPVSSDPSLDRSSELSSDLTAGRPETIEPT